MKNHFLLVCLSISCLLMACNGNNSNNDNNVSEQSTEITDQPKESEDSPAQFDLEKIPVVANVGEFPYFSAPNSYKYSSEKNKEYEEKYFFYDNGLVKVVGGKYFHTQIHPEDNVEFSETFVLNNYKKAIKKAGGVELYSGPIPFKATDLITEKKPAYTRDLYDYQSTQYKQFVIRTPNENIWIELNYGGNVNFIDLTVVKEEKLKESIAIIKADDMQKELEVSGKAVVYIKFDIDKATLKQDGEQAVEEIAKLLNSTKSLKLSIEGHTDNTGSAAHNKTLSQKRAETVLNSLVSTGIEKSRLKAVGFGGEKPLVPNNTEENKSKNRRVELVKM